MIENLDRQLAALDPEAGRCWKTDGEKWDLMAGQKYFEGDMHHGPERFKKACGNITGYLPYLYACYDFCIGLVSMLEFPLVLLGLSDRLNFVVPFHMILRS